MAMTSPTEREIEEMIQTAMDDICKQSGGEFDKHATAFFSAGFRYGMLAMIQRVVLSEMPDIKGKH